MPVGAAGAGGSMSPGRAMGSWGGGNSRWLASRAAAKKRNMGRFAQALADGLTGSISDAARAAGISQQTGSLYFREICHTINSAQQAAGFGDWAI